MSDDGSNEQLVELAAVTRSHGLRGELLLKLFNPDSALLESLPRVLLKSRAGDVRQHGVIAARPHARHLLLTLQGINTREQADELRGSLVCVRRAELPALEEGEYYLIDLVGLRVQSREGAELGTVQEVLEYPSAHCLVVVGADGVREVPNIERYVLEVDVPGKLVVVDHLDEIEASKPKGAR